MTERKTGTAKRGPKVGAGKAKIGGTAAVTPKLDEATTDAPLREAEPDINNTDPAYQGGREAAKLGHPLRACPYKAGGEDALQWHKGHHDYSHRHSTNSVVPRQTDSDGGPY